MDLDLFETYVVLCETRSITKTAELLYKTQPAISVRIQQLERELGCTLIHREKGKKTISLTPRGEEFLETAQKFTELYGELYEKRLQLTNSLTISSIGSLSASLVADICSRVISQYQMKLSLLVYQTMEAYQLVANRQLDLAFVSMESEVAGVLCEEIFTLDYVVVQACECPKEPLLVGLDHFDPKMEIYQNWNPAFDAWHDSHLGNNKYLIQVDACNVMKRFLHLPGSWAIVQRNNLPEIEQELSVQVFQLQDPPPVRTCYMISNVCQDRLNALAVRQFKEAAFAYSRGCGLISAKTAGIL